MNSVACVISYGEYLKKTFEYINHNNIDLICIITINHEEAIGLCKQYGIECQIYAMDEIEQCLLNTKVDYYFVCGLEDEVISILRRNNISEKAIINLKMVGECYLDTKSFYNIIRYIESKQNRFDYFITGISYFEVGLDLKCLGNTGVNLAVSSQDIYWSYEIAKYIIPRGLFKYALIGLAPYSFQFDMSQSKYSFRTQMYFPLFKKVNNYCITENMFNNIFSENYLELYNKTSVQLEVDLNDRWNTKKYCNSRKISIQDIVKAKQIACRLGGKNFPKTKEENINLFEQYIQLCLDNQIKPVILVLPFHSILRKYYPARELDEFRYILKKMKSKYTSIKVLDLFELNLDHSYFYDLEHLNCKGAHCVSTYIGDYLKQCGII